MLTYGRTKTRAQKHTQIEPRGAEFLHTVAQITNKTPACAKLFAQAGVPLPHEKKGQVFSGTCAFSGRDAGSFARLCALGIFCENSRARQNPRRAKVSIIFLTFPCFPLLPLSSLFPILRRGGLFCAKKPEKTALQRVSL